jgi:flagellar biosynthesis/type III secretory pathway protein FliH
MRFTDATDFDFAPLESAAVVVPSGDPQAEAAMLLAAAGAEAAELRANAHAEGLAAGRAEALAAVSPAAAALEQAAGAVRAEAEAAAERLETQAVELALMLAEKIVGAAVEAKPELVVEAVRGALRGLVERERITVLVNPADLELVREAIGGVVAAMGGIEHCDVQAERRVGRGGAVVRTPDGDVDASVDAKLERAREVVAAALGAA